MLKKDCIIAIMYSFLTLNKYKSIIKNKWEIKIDTTNQALSTVFQKHSWQGLTCYANIAKYFVFLTKFIKYRQKDIDFFEK